MIFDLMFNNRGGYLLLIFFTDDGAAKSDFNLVLLDSKSCLLPRAGTVIAMDEDG